MSVAEIVRQHFSFLNDAERRRLSDIDASPQPSADGAAILLGHDLRIEPLRRFHEALTASGDAPPPLWQFSWEPHDTWDANAWLALPLEARVLRTRAGSPMRYVGRRLDPSVLQLDRAFVARGLAALRDAGLAHGLDRISLDPVATGAGIATDVAIVELIVHWLRMLTHRDRIVQRSPGNELDVCGYAGACNECRARWTSVPQVAEAIPPFHPGCRCFAQPRWASGEEFDDNLIKALEHPVPDVAATAARVLGTRAPDRALVALLRTSRSKDPERAEAALEALARYRTDSARERLVEACERGTARERAIARAALRRLDDDERRK